MDQPVPKGGASTRDTSFAQRSTTVAKSTDRYGIGRQPRGAAEFPKVPPRFQLRGLLGRGGMGTVYAAYDQLFGYEVALKSLHGLGAEDRYRLKTEFRSLANTVHPNLVRLHDLVVNDDACFFTMELIRGVDFVSDARVSAEPKRLFDRARQLAVAISALHRGSLLHRDIKPSNVLVTPTGRVVLLDFGLLASLDTREDEDEVAGTLEYMAPEQLFGAGANTAADWYSFGATLYQSIAGVTPVQISRSALGFGNFDQIAPLSTLVPDVPAGLEDLIMRLLQTRPDARPSGAEVLAFFGASEPLEATAIVSGVTESAAHVLCGRESELALLDEALADVQPNGIRVVHLYGPSGVGKTELVRTFIRRRSLDAALLHGRCHPQEIVPFNALDRLIDRLVAMLHRLPQETLAAVVPKDFAALTHLFPVLGALSPPTASALASAMDMASVRHAACAALRELLKRLSAQRPLVLWLDDVQWGDGDSGVLLRELLLSTDAPRVLVILSYRSEERASSACLRAMTEARELPAERVTALELQPLDQTNSLAVLRELSGVPAGSFESELARLAQEAAGLPFFLAEIARQLRERLNDSQLPSLSLRDVVGRRLSQLPEAARRMLEVLAVAGGPLEYTVLLRAAAVLDDERATTLVLERLSLLRTADLATHTAELYHDRLRAELLGMLGKDEQRGYHLTIAEALVTHPGASAQKLVEHYTQGGDLTSSRRYVVAAAMEAWSALAFDRAAQLYQLALNLGATDLREPELHERHARALAYSGRGRDAGRAYESAALAWRVEETHDPGRVVSLQRMAAEHFLKSGHHAEGMTILKGMLAKLGLSYPTTRPLALVSGLARRIRAGVDPRPRKAATPNSLERIDALWAMAMGMGFLDHLRAGYFSAYCYSESARVSSDLYFMRASAIESTQWSCTPGAFFERRAERMIAAAEALVPADQAPYEHGVLHGARAAMEWFNGRWLSAVHLADAGVDTLTQHCHGVSFELALLHNWSLSALALAGELGELRRRLPELLAEAEQRDDRFLARGASLGQQVLGWLSLDRPRETLERIERAMYWFKGDDCTVPYYHYYLAKAQVLLYQRDALAAFECTQQHWPLLKRNLLLGVSCLRDELWYLRGRTALALAIVLTAERRAERKLTAGALLKMTLSAAEALDSHGLGCAAVWAALLRAGVRHVQGRERESREQLAAALAHSASPDLKLFREVARYCSTRSDRSQAAAWFAEQGVANVPAFVGMLAPGCLRDGVEAGAPHA